MSLLREGKRLGGKQDVGVVKRAEAGSCKKCLLTRGGVWGDFEVSSGSVFRSRGPGNEGLNGLEEMEGVVS